MDSKRNNSDVVEIDLAEVAGLLIHRAWLIIICAVLAAAAAFCISSFLVTDLYESTTSVYILNKQDGGTVTYSDVQLGTQLTKDYAQLIRSRYVVEKVIENCGLETTYAGLSKRISVETPSDTRILEITVTDEDRVMAQYIANEIRKEAAAHIKNVMDIQAVNVVDEANLPDKPSSPDVFKWTVIGFALGAFACAAGVLAHFMLDDTIKTSDDVEKYLGLSTLGMIPIREDAEKLHRGNRHENPVTAVHYTNRSEPDTRDGHESDNRDMEEEIIDMNEEITDMNEREGV